MTGGESYVLFAYEPLSDLSRSYWNGSVEKLLDESPPDVHYVFMSYGDTPEEVGQDVGTIRTRVEAAIAGLADEADRKHWAEHVHFVTRNPLTLEGAWGDLLVD